MRKYRVAIIGLGPRGILHGEGFLANADRFELVAICDRDEQRLQAAAPALGNPALYADAVSMLREVQPDVLCFATLPSIRLSLVELGAAYGVKALAFEKPLALTLSEAAQIREVCHLHKMKAVVCHQMRYLTAFQQLKQLVDEDAIGELTHIHATTVPWLAQLGTHFINYMRWINGESRALWAVGHVHGKEKLADSHPSPDYAVGHLLFENGVRGILESGYASPSYHARNFWLDNRITVYGTRGFVWAETDGRWGACIGGQGNDASGSLINKQEARWGEQRLHIQAAYLRELADWLDDDEKTHSCCVDNAYHGQEILEGICLSALTNARITFPLDPLQSGDLVERMRAELPE